MAGIERLLSCLMMIAFLGPFCFCQTNSTTDVQEIKIPQATAGKKFKNLKNKNQNQMDRPKETTLPPQGFIEIRNLSDTSAVSLIKEPELKLAPIQPLPVTTRSPPVTDAYYVVDSTTGEVCILAKFDAKITINYPTEGSKNSEMSITISPKVANSNGKCANLGADDTDASLRIAMLMANNKYELELNFKVIKRGKSDEIDKWVMSSLEFRYNTEDSSNFPNDLQKEFYTARSANTSSFFTSPMNTSYACHEEKPIPLFSDNSQHTVTVVLTKIKIRPYNVPRSLDFKPENFCTHNFQKHHYRDDTVPIAMGSTFAVLALVVIIGYAVHRSMSDRKMEYKNVD